MEETRAAVKKNGHVYRHIYRNKASSRQMIAKDLGISLPTVAHALNQLKEDGLIYQAGEFESTGGRKANMLQIVPDARLAVGIDITQSGFVMLLVNLRLEVLDYVKVPLAFADVEEYCGTICTQLEEFLDKNQVERGRFLGVGISLPAIIGEEKIVAFAKVIDLPGDFYERMSARIPYPLSLFNDANSAGWAEKWLREGEAPMVYLSLSSSVGGAILMNRAYTGTNWRGAEFGHMTIVPNGQRCYCGSCGCLDAYCSADVLSDFADGDIREFFARMKQTENKGYRRVFTRYMEHLAVAVNNLRMCFDCDVVLGGSVGACMEEYLEEFRAMAAQRTPFEDRADYIQVCSFRTEPAAVGAALYYIDRFVRKL